MIIALIIVDGFQFSIGAFFTFYLPNAIRPSGYKELSKIVKAIDKEIGPTSNFAADISYFWKTMDIEVDESVCTEALARFKPLAEGYSEIDYQYYIRPIHEYKDYILDYRQEIYPAGTNRKFYE